MNKLIRSLTASVLLTASALVAQAAVSFDSATGQGFIGRGDVIDHPTLGKNALVQSPLISLQLNLSYEVEIEWTTGPSHNRKTHTITRSVSLNLAAVTESETRNAKGKNENHVTGYRLLGYLEEAQAEAAFTPPQVGDVILDNDNIQKVIVSVTVLDATGARLKFDAVPTGLVGYFNVP